MKAFPIKVGKKKTSWWVGVLRVKFGGVLTKVVRQPCPIPSSLRMNLATVTRITFSHATRPSHLHVEERRPVARPFLDQCHVLSHGLLLAHALKFLPLVNDTGSSGGHFFFDPHVQHLLFLCLLPNHRAGPEAPPQCPLQEARPPLLQPLTRGEAFGRLADAGLESLQRVNVFERRDGRVQGIVALQVLEPQSCENLEVFFRGRVVAVDNGFMRLREGGQQR